MSDTDRIDFLQGQIQVLLAFSFAMIETHPDRRQLLVYLNQNLEGTLAKISGTAVPEPLVDGIQDMKDRLLEYAIKSAARQPSA